MLLPKSYVRRAPPPPLVGRRQLNKRYLRETVSYAHGVNSLAPTTKNGNAHLTLAEFPVRIHLRHDRGEASSVLIPLYFVINEQLGNF